MLARIRRFTETAWRWLRAPLAGVVVLVVVGGLVSLAWWLIELPFPKDPKDPTLFLMKDRWDVMIKAMAGAAAVYGLYLAWRRSESASTQADMALKQAVTAEQGHITDRFTKAIELLGNSDLAVRIGGIYALERIALDSERDHWTVMEVLCAYVRKHRPRRTETAENEAEETDHGKVPIDILAILTVLQRREYKRENIGLRQYIDLSDTDLRGAYFGDPYLWFADLSRADLTGAILNGAKLKAATLWLTDLTHANLNGADLTAAHFDDTILTGTSLRGGADLTHAQNLTKGQIESAYGNEHTKLPEGFIMPDHWKTGYHARPLEDRDRESEDSADQ